MSDYATRYYGTITLKLQPAEANKRIVKFTHTGLKNDKGNEYETEKCHSPEEAFTYAKGLIDCINFYTSCYKDINEDKELYKKEFEEMLDIHKKNRYEQDVKMPSYAPDEIMGVIEKSYRKGWDAMLLELKNIDGATYN